jgi:hypothetical protein
MIISNEKLAIRNWRQNKLPGLSFGDHGSGMGWHSAPPFGRLKIQKFYFRTASIFAMFSF